MRDKNMSDESDQLIADEAAKSPYPMPGEPGAPIDLPNDWSESDAN